jgi:hypothetical protein
MLSGPLPRWSRPLYRVPTLCHVLVAWGGLLSFAVIQGEKTYFSVHPYARGRRLGLSSADARSGEPLFSGQLLASPTES